MVCWELSLVKVQLIQLKFIATPTLVLGAYKQARHWFMLHVFLHYQSFNKLKFLKVVALRCENFRTYRSIKEKFTTNYFTRAIKKIKQILIGSSPVKFYALF